MPSDALKPRNHQILLEDLSVMADIGFHDFEVGTPQRLLITVAVTLDMAHWPATDCRDDAWNYDFIREGIHALVKGRRFNLQETLVAEIFAMVASHPGVTALKVQSRKPDVYPDSLSVGVILSSH